MKSQKRAILIILDGWGHGIKRKADAIAQAKTPFINSLYQKYPNAELITFGEDVGLPVGQMGNSEVGHMNIGAGRIVYQELTRISKSVRDKELHQNPTLLAALRYAKENNKAVHLMGLVSDGGVHSHIDHLLALCDIAQTEGCNRVFIHAFTDGRDTDPKSGIHFIETLEKHLQVNNAKIASVVGRYYAMDRDKRWERIKRAYELLVNGISFEDKHYESASAGILANYSNGISDEFMEPFSVSGVNGKLQADDVVISFNFRTDRPREITEVLTQNDMHEFNMHKLPLRYVTMTRYDDTYKGVDVLFQKDDLSQTIGEVISKEGLTQVRIAETEKYPHVTFFFSGGREDVFEGESRIMIPSPKVATYDLQPEMSAKGITDAIIEKIKAEQPNFICLNYANTDMVGHTGVFKAAMKAAQTVDKCCKKLIKTALEFDYEAIIIADHGNSDYMINEDGSPNTAHTTNMVPCFFVSKNAKNASVSNGRLADVAPTLLGILGITPPSIMDGKNLIEYK